MVSDPLTDAGGGSNSPGPRVRLKTDQRPGYRPMGAGIKTKYYDAANDTHYLIFLKVFPMKFTKAAQYQNATNDTHNLISSWSFP